MKKDRKSYVHIYIPPELRERLDKIQRRMTVRNIGARVAMTELTRQALEFGVEIFEKKLGEYDD